MAQVPSNLIPTRVSQLPNAPVASEDGLLLFIYEGVSYKIRAGDLLSVAGVPTNRQVIAGTGLTGGGQLVNNITLSIAPGGVGTSQLASTGVTPGTYGDATKVPVFTVDSTGRLMSAGTVDIQVTGTGTVTSVDVSGGLTGLDATGGPITDHGTITLSGVLNLSSGGTGATTAIDALANLGGYPLTNPAGYTTNTGTVTSVSGTGSVNGINLSGSVTNSGSLTLGGALVVSPADFGSQIGNTVLAGPNGAGGNPTFRFLVPADVPTLNQNTTGTASNVTGVVAVANGGTGVTSLGIGVVTALGNNVGAAGSVVVNGGALGTPSSGTLTNTTGLPISTGVSGLGAGVATFLGTPSSANLAAAVTGETGSGALVFGTAPTLDTAIITATGSIDALRITNTGTGNSLLVEDSANPDSSPFVVDNAGNVGIGTTNPLTQLHLFAAPQATARVASTSYSMDVLVQESSNTAAIRTNTATPIVFLTNGSERMRLDTSGNLGLGVTPSAWSFYKGIDVNTYGAFSADTASVTMGGNAYFNTADWKYKQTGVRASDYYQANGSHVWRTAPSGTAGAAITYTQAMTLANSGNLGIGTTSPGSKLDVKGTLRLSGSTSGYVGLAPAAAAGSTTYTLPSADGTSGQLLSTNGTGTLSWASGAIGTVTSVSGTGTVSGISLSGTVISSGSLTLGGSLDLSSPPAIGGTTANLITGTTVTATKFVGISGGTF